MNQPDYDFQVPPPSRDVVYVAWGVTWQLDRYIEEYLRTRKVDLDHASRAAAKHCIDVYTAPPPFRKADLDYFLDVNLPIVGKK